MIANIHFIYTVRKTDIRTSRQAKMFAKPRPKKSPLPPPSKKRKASAVEEVTFDNTAREEYLNGFHKRKVQRQKHAQEEAAKRAREEKIEFRKQVSPHRDQPTTSRFLRLWSGWRT